MGIELEALWPTRTVASIAAWKLLTFKDSIWECCNVIDGGTRQYQARGVQGRISCIQFDSR